MLRHAIKGRVPLIHVRLEDTVYAPAVLQELTGIKFKEYDGQISPTEGGVYLKVSRKGKGPEDSQKLFKIFRSHDATLVYTNIDDVPPEFLDLGAIAPPPSLLKKELSASIHLDHLNGAIMALGGLSVKDATNVAVITIARDREITAAGLVKTRQRLLKTSKGLTLVDPYMAAYQPDPKLQAWAAAEKHEFLYGSDARLRARGLLFDGPPGVGKTMGAKYLAQQWGIPLFRLDATFQNKYVGETENNFGIALRTAESAAPAILLIDEIEKFFAGAKGDNTGIMLRVMGSALWWLQEHDAKILTVMTTNDRAALPPELYREGRVDQVMVFEKLKNPEEILGVAKVVWNSFEDGEMPDELIDQLCPPMKVAMLGGPSIWNPVSHTHVTQVVRNFVKSQHQGG